MAELWGPAAGISARRQEDAEIGLRDMQARNLMSDIAARPAETRYKTAAARRLEIENEQEERFAEASKDIQFEGGMADVLDQFALTAANAGQPTKAGEFAGKAAQIRAAQATQLSEQAQEQERRYKLAIEKADRVNQLFGMADSPESWEAANRIFEVISGQPSPYKDVPFTPEAAEKIGRQTLKFKDAMELRLKETQQQNLEQLRKRQADSLALRDKLTEQQISESKAREAKIKKEGGSEKPDLSTNRRMALNTIKTDWEIEAAEAELLADQINERAAAMLRENPGLKGSEAVTRAYGEAKDAGAFEGLPPNPLKRGTSEAAAQKALAEKYGVPYDPGYTYREKDGKLQRKKK